MFINEKNEELYKKAFISDDEYEDFNNWKPSINEEEIEEWCTKEKDGEEVWIPATPLGYRDYEISRSEGLKNIFSESECKTFTYEEIHNIKREDNIVKQYDKLNIDGSFYIVAGDDENCIYIVSKDDHKYSIAYLKD